MKALIVRLSSIGDVVHTLPCLAALDRAGFGVGWTVDPPALPLLEGHPLLGQVARVPSSRAFNLPAARATLRSLRAEKYDVALDFQGLWKSAAWARLSGAPRILGFAAAWRKEPLSSTLIRETCDLPPNLLHVIDKNLALLRPLGVEAVGGRDFPLPPTEEAARRVEAALNEREIARFVILNPGGGWASKLWPPELYGHVARDLRDPLLRALVTWGPGEERLAERVVLASNGVAIRCFPTTLLEYVELARRAEVVVAADTGPLHLACAVGTPVVGLFGPTDPARNGPFSARDAVVRRTPLCCPCHRRRCATHEGVMQAIEPAEVLRAVEQRLASAAGVGAVV